jgi:hypothetical protein
MKNLISRVEALKRLLKPKLIPWGKIYDALREIDLRTGASDDFENWFMEKNGSREEFIKLKEAQRHGL